MEGPTVQLDKEVDVCARSLRAVRFCVGKWDGVGYYMLRIPNCTRQLWVQSVPKAYGPVRTVGFGPGIDPSCSATVLRQRHRGREHEAGGKNAPAQDHATIQSQHANAPSELKKAISTPDWREPFKSPFASPTSWATCPLTFLELYHLRVRPWTVMPASTVDGNYTSENVLGIINCLASLVMPDYIVPLEKKNAVVLRPHVFVIWLRLAQVLPGDSRG